MIDASKFVKLFVLPELAGSIDGIRYLYNSFPGRSQNHSVFAVGDQLILNSPTVFPFPGTDLPLIHQVHAKITDPAGQLSKKNPLKRNHHDPSNTKGKIRCPNIKCNAVLMPLSACREAGQPSS